MFDAHCVRSRLHHVNCFVRDSRVSNDTAALSDQSVVCSVYHTKPFSRIASLKYPSISGNHTRSYGSPVGREHIGS